jgi:TolB-like protein/DNA-binding winged helix-turn-helix (wHTH) protein
LVAKNSAIVYRFEPYELHASAQELLKHGVRLKVRPQPLRLLTLLLSRAGQVVSREEIRAQLWSADTFVDFEHGLNTAVKVLRGALNDSVATPTFIETLPKIGYRFIAPVTVVGEIAEAAAPGPPTAEPPMVGSYPTQFEAPRPGGAAVAQTGSHPNNRTRFLWIVIAAALLAATVLAGYYSRVSAVRARTSVRGGRTVLAVLPFQNLTGGADEDYFSDGLTEELIAQFGRLDPEHLGVIARTSVMHYKHSDEPLAQIARELGVQYALEGSVRRDADKVRISAQLIQIKDQTRLWSREYDRELSNLLALQSEIANDIGSEIRITLGDSRREPAAEGEALSPQSVEAHDLYLKALYFWNQRSPQGFHRAVDYFQQSVQKDPSYAPAYAGLADSYVLMSGFEGFPPKELLAKARSAAQKGVQLGGSLAETHTARALVAQDFDWDWQTAEKEYRRAIELNPNYATAHHWYAEYLALMGRFDEASAQIELARVLDPLSLIIATDRGVILYYARQYDHAIEVLRAVQEMYPAYPRTDTIDHAYIATGKTAEATADLAKFPAGEHEEPWFWGQKAYVAGRVGQIEVAREALGKLQRMNRDGQIDSIVLATAELGLNDKKQALTWLEKAHAEHSPSLTGLKVDPIYDPLRGDARFQAILREMNFPR